MALQKTSAQITQETFIRARKSPPLCMNNSKPINDAFFGALNVAGTYTDCIHVNTLRPFAQHPKKHIWLNKKMVLAAMNQHPDLNYFYPHQDGYGNLEYMLSIVNSASGGVLDQALCGATALLKTQKELFRTENLHMYDAPGGPPVFNQIQLQIQQQVAAAPRRRNQRMVVVPAAAQPPAADALEWLEGPNAHNANPADIYKHVHECIPQKWYIEGKGKMRSAALNQAQNQLVIIVDLEITEKLQPASDYNAVRVLKMIPPQVANLFTHHRTVKTIIGQVTLQIPLTPVRNLTVQVPYPNNPPPIAVYAAAVHNSRVTVGEPTSIQAQIVQERAQWVAQRHATNLIAASMRNNVPVQVQNEDIAINFIQPTDIAAFLAGPVAAVNGKPGFCPLCYKYIDVSCFQILRCGHIFCKTCWTHASMPKKSCAMCRAKVYGGAGAIPLAQIWNVTNARIFTYQQARQREIARQNLQGYVPVANAQPPLIMAAMHQEVQLPHDGRYMPGAGFLPPTAAETESRPPEVNLSPAELRRQVNQVDDDAIGSHLGRRTHSQRKDTYNQVLEDENDEEELSTPNKRMKVDGKWLYTTLLPNRAYTGQESFLDPDTQTWRRYDDCVVNLNYPGPSDNQEEAKQEVQVDGSEANENAGNPVPDTENEVMEEDESAASLLRATEQDNNEDKADDGF